MTQLELYIVAQIIYLPVGVEFRTAKVQWTRVAGRITGWRRGKVKQEYLIAEIQTGGRTRSISLSPQNLPATLREECLATLGKSNADDAIRQICSAFEPVLFHHASATLNDDAEFKKRTKPADAWHLRDEFLRMKPDVKRIGSFLNKWGRWKESRDFIFEKELFDLQGAVRVALSASPDKWWTSHYAYPLIKHSGSSGFLGILTDSCEAAIRMTTTFDLLRKLQFKTCARGDCAIPFSITSNHTRHYCSQYCAHLESVRRTRKSKPQRGSQDARERTQSEEKEQDHGGLQASWRVLV
jgi:hypothetical protein